ncbi:MAG: 50S ribosomal protein L21 [Candidatus Dormibacteria bacterium]|jgi:large subunit ribosomal protein L21
MYAIIQHGGHQYRVSSGDRLVVNRLPDDVGAVIGLEPVLLVSDADGLRTGDASLDGVRVAATVVSHTRGKKLRILTYKPKKRHRKTLGFRSDLTELRVEGVLARGEALPARLVVVEEPEATEEAPEPVAKPARGRRAAAAEAAPAVEEAAPEAPAKPARTRRAAPAAKATSVAEETALEAPAPAAKPARSQRTAPAAEEAAPEAAAAKPARTRRAATPAAEETAPEAPAAAKPARSHRVAKGPAATPDPEV